MAYHDAIKNGRKMTLKECIEEFKYMQPDGVFVIPKIKRTKPEEVMDYQVDYIEVRDGIVHYFVSEKAPWEE